MKKFLNERGILMLDAVFLTLITAFAAMILFNAAPRVKNSQSALRLTALYLANEQIAQLESLAATGESLEEKFLGNDDDLTSENFGMKIKFEVTTQINYDKNPYEVTVKVSWTENDFVEIKRVIYFVEKE